MELTVSTAVTKKKSRIYLLPKSLKFIYERW